MRLADERGADVAPGEIGDLYISGPTAAAGYWNQHEKTRTTFCGEWIRSGDKYSRDESGFYTYAGRSDDMLKVSGIYVSPFEVEAALASHEAVLESAVDRIRPGIAQDRHWEDPAIQAARGRRNLM